jgi:hypothetical protein
MGWDVMEEGVDHAVFFMISAAKDMRLHYYTTTLGYNPYAF